MAEYDYEVFVIGAGSGGLAASKEAAALGVKVAVADYVIPSPAGTTWGIGGTCVNVGCIPKKLMHNAAILGEEIRHARAFGWQFSEAQHHWNHLVDSVQKYIFTLNTGYREQLRDKHVEYFNAMGRFVDEHTIECTDYKGRKFQKTARYIVIATGGRPNFPEIPGATEYGISSDDVFSLSSPPGKTLVVGASYIALECAGFLNELGFDTTVMVRSILLRGFDQQIANRIGDSMEYRGVKFLRSCIPAAIEKQDDRLLVHWTDADGNNPASDFFDTVLFAVGRKPCTDDIGLENTGVQLDRSGKVLTTNEQSSVPHIFAIGDIITDSASGMKLELTPVAIQAGTLLARRILGASDITMDYYKVPTTVFTSIEYSCCGLSEEEAIEKYGEDRIEVYHRTFLPLEYGIVPPVNHFGHQEKDLYTCYCKVITDLEDEERVIGIHILSPHSGEVMQGFAAAMRCGLTKYQLDMTVGIHPTTAEELTTLTITKRSGESFEKAGGC